MNVTPLIGTTGFPIVDRDSGELLPFEYMVTDLAVGEDPLSDPIIPRVGTEVEFGGRKYRCDRVGVTEPYSDGACKVAAFFSTDGRFRFAQPRLERSDVDFRDWDLSYKKTQIKLPLYVKGQKTSVNEAGATVVTDAWFDQSDTLDIEMDVLSVQVTIPVQQDDIRSIIEFVRLQRSKLHTFLGSDWLMRMPFIRQNKENELSISYVWESDPGNEAVGQPAELAPDQYVAAPARGPFQIYRTLPVLSEGETPRIVVIDLFPPGSPAREPNGWRDLPGSPL